MDDLSADTLASPPQIAGPLPTSSDSRLSTVLPKVEWKGEIPHLVSNNRDRFEELGLLGRGGMGEVVLAKDHDIGRTVALKRMLPGTDIGRVLRFVDEVRAVGSLEHPNIVPVHDVGVDAGGRFFFVMKKLDGETLESVIQRLRTGDPAAREEYSFAKRAQIFLGVLAAVEYAHRQGFIHRDLKPANIMLGPCGEVTVMDWGLAKRIRGPQTHSLAPEAASPSAPGRQNPLSTQLGSIIGTPLYMSPEQARGDHDKVDERSDIYSLTVLFHEFCFLRHYLTGRTSLAEVLEGVKETVPQHVGMWNFEHTGKVPAELQWYVFRGLQKQPEDRFQSVSEMMLALQRALDGRFAMQCGRTTIKRVLLGLTRGLDRHPVIFESLIPAGALISLIAVGKLVFDLLRTL